MACPGGTSQKVLLNASTVGTPGGLPDRYYQILCVIRYMSIYGLGVSEILGLFKLVGPGHAFWSALEPRFSYFKLSLKKIYISKFIIFIKKKKKNPTP